MAAAVSTGCGFVSSPLSLSVADTSFGFWRRCLRCLAASSSSSSDDGSARSVTSRPCRFTAHDGHRCNNGTFLEIVFSILKFHSKAKYEFAKIQLGTLLSKIQLYQWTLRYMLHVVAFSAVEPQIWNCLPAGLQPFQTVAEDIFIWSAGQKHSVKIPLTALENPLTHLLSKLGVVAKYCLEDKLAVVTVNKSSSILIIY